MRTHYLFSLDTEICRRPLLSVTAANHLRNLTIKNRHESCEGTVRSLFGLGLRSSHSSIVLAIGFTRIKGCLIYLTKNHCLDKANILFEFNIDWSSQSEVTWLHTDLGPIDLYYIRFPRFDTKFVILGKKSPAGQNKFILWI